LLHGKNMCVEKTGNVKLGLNFILNDVLYIPRFSCNLISSREFTKDTNFLVTYGDDFCLILDRTSKKPIRAGDLKNGVYYLKMEPVGSVFVALQSEGSVNWHQRLRHPSFGSLTSLSSICGFKLNKEFYACCDVCYRAKQTRNIFPLSSSKAK